MLSPWCMILLQLLGELSTQNRQKPCNYWSSNSCAQSRKYLHALCFSTIPASQPVGMVFPVQCGISLSFHLVLSDPLRGQGHLWLLSGRKRKGVLSICISSYNCAIPWPGSDAHPWASHPFGDSKSHSPLGCMGGLGPEAQGWQFLQCHSAEEKVRVFTAQKACFCPNLKTYKMESVSRGLPNCRKQERTFFLYFLLFWYANKERLQGKLYCANVRHRCYILCIHRQLSLTSDLAQTLILGSTRWSQKGVRFPKAMTELTAEPGKKHGASLLTSSWVLFLSYFPLHHHITSTGRQLCACLCIYSHSDLMLTDTYFYLHSIFVFLWKEHFLSKTTPPVFSQDYIGAPIGGP